MSGYTIRRVSELDEILIPGASIRWRPIRRPLGIRAFGINAYCADAGEHVVEEHTEEFAGHEEVYVVLAGRARFTLDGEHVEAEQGTIVHVAEPSVRRAAVALADGTTVLAVGAKPGEAFEPSPWEWWFATSPQRERGDYAAALAVVREGLEEQPEHPVLHFQVAVLEAVTGNADEALARLESAFAGDERIVEWARDHRLLETVRDDPRFRRLLERYGG
ncbi:MAG TPA: tetratricopeptide repeat protein [Gaiellaceae bacterium]|nr:tetratricopeptide repeat protein [Gaiellaceae bacterium]